MNGVYPAKSVFAHSPTNPNTTVTRPSWFPSRILRDGFHPAVPQERLELSLPKEADFESAASTIPPSGHWSCPLAGDMLSTRTAYKVSPQSASDRSRTDTAQLLKLLPPTSWATLASVLGTGHLHRPVHPRNLPCSRASRIPFATSNQAS